MLIYGVKYNIRSLIQNSCRIIEAVIFSFSHEYEFQGSRIFNVNYFSVIDVQ